MITAKEKKKRQQVIKHANANQALEGLTVSKFAKQLDDDYIAGKISATQMRDKIKQRYES